MKLLPTIVLIALLWMPICACTSQAQNASPSGLASEPIFDTQTDQMGTVDFFGSDNAVLFSKEVSESFKGALKLNYVSSGDSKFPPGFLQASPIPQGWSGSMWTRDGGTFMRELTAWGYYQHACQVAECLMDMVGTNEDGFIAFPRFFRPGEIGKTGTEMDGEGAIIIAMVSLWQRLPPDDAFRSRLYNFLHQPASPVRGLHSLLQQHPLIPGSGEFGGGADPKNLYCNVVQNNLCAMAFLSVAEMEEAAGDKATAKLWRKDAKTLHRNIEKYLVAADGSWIWCIDSDLRPDPAILHKPVNAGFGGLNGPLCMSADVLGFNPENWPWPGNLAHGEKTFEDLYHVPQRKELFDQYGIWTQFDKIHQGNQTGPSYGQGYALQSMLLMDKMDMAGHGLDFLAHGTFDCQDVTFNDGRMNPYYFFERLYAPGVKGTAGCGPLNLVNVSEPLKVARLIVGMDDTSANEVQIVPRVPPSWSGYRVENWPIRTSHGIVRANISYERKDGAITFSLKITQGGAIPKLAVRLPGKNGYEWKRQKNVEEVNFDSSAS